MEAENVQQKPKSQIGNSWRNYKSLNQEETCVLGQSKNMFNMNTIAE